MYKVEKVNWFKVHLIKSFMIYALCLLDYIFHPFDLISGHRGNGISTRLVPLLKEWTIKPSSEQALKDESLINLIMNNSKLNIWISIAKGLPSFAVETVSKLNGQF